MIKILIGLLFVYGFLHFIAPVLRIYYEYIRVGMIMKKLGTGGNRLFQNVKIPDYHILRRGEGRPVTACAPSGNTWSFDYILQSGDRLILIRLLSFPRRRVMLRGSLQSKNWSWKELGRLYIPIIGNSLDYTESIKNPFHEMDTAMICLRKYLDLPGDKMTFHPIVVILPKIKIVNIASLLSEENSTHLIYYGNLEKTIQTYLEAIQPAILLDDDQLYKLYKTHFSK